MQCFREDGKIQIEPSVDTIIFYVKSLALQFYPLEHHENEKGSGRSVW